MNRHGSMNRIYRLVWSQVSSAWVPVAETAKSRGKSRRARGRVRSISLAGRNALAAAISLALAPLAHAAAPAATCVTPSCGAGAVASSAHPLGGQVVSGGASITQLGNVTDIRQSSGDVVIDWLSFNVGSQASVDFIQPSQSSIAVNQISGTNGSQILGHVDANGQVYLINPNGIIFGQGAQVNVGGLVASTLDVGDSTPSDGRRRFAGGGTGSIVNQGTINAANGGYVVLVGNRVSNQGIITAQLGTVALGAGNAVTLDFSGDRLVHLQVDQSTLNDLAANQQLIEADGGLVIMTAGAQRSLLASVVNNTGVIEARTVESHSGTIELLGGTTAGTVNVGGTLDASAPDGGNGGFIETNATHVEVGNDARITTAAARGLTGSWLVDPQDFTIAPSGGDITGATLSAELGTTSVTLLSSSGATAGSGNINVDDTVSWSANTLTLTAANNINVNAVMTATGSASLALNPSTANGADAAVPGGTVVMGLTGSGFIGMVNFSSTGTLSIDGTPYTVINSLGAAGSTTGKDLQGMNGNLSGDYVLGSNINAAATSSWNGGSGFAPIGTSATSFTGIFDGLGHTVSNLYIDRATTSFVGLFGYGSASAVIRNVGLIGGSVSGASFVGELLGIGYGSTVNNTYATGNVTGGDFVGGLLGAISGCFMSCSGISVNGTVSNSYATGTVSGSSNVGGLVGASFYSEVSNSYATGAVSGSSIVGGLVGQNNYGLISNSRAAGKVSGSSSDIGGLLGYNYSGDVVNSLATGSVTGSSGSSGVGGLVGFSTYGPSFNNANVSNSYAMGPVTGGNGVGGLVGFNEASIYSSYSTGRVSGSSDVGGLVGSGGGVTSGYWNTMTSGQSTSAGGTGLTTAQMQTAANFSGFTFTTTPGASGNNWVIVDIDGTLNNAGGAAGAVFPMLASEYSTTINNTHQLQLMAMNLGASYTLGQNISAVGTGNGTNVWGTSGFIPIGSASTPFFGEFNGLGHTISNLTINLPSSNYVGLFGYAASGSVIQNVGLVGGSVVGSNDVGALVGYNYGGSINNSYVSASVSGAQNVGGMVGENYSYGSIRNSYATGNVNGNTWVGGLVGNNSGGVFTSYATGNVSGTYGVGGLIGGNGAGFGYGYSAEIANSYATGKVSGSSDVGGLMGYNSGFIGTSYATGAVSGTGNYVGGLVGYDNQWTDTGYITNSYATGTVKGSNYVGGLVGYNSGIVYDSYASGSVSGSSKVGGLVGGNVGTTSYEGAPVSISNSYATGRVSGTSNVGGLVGSNVGAYGMISNSYATGSVSGATGSQYVGGLVGYNSGTVTTSYSAGSVTGTSSTGGLVGYNYGSGTVSNSFWDTAASGQATSAGGIGMTTANMQNQANFTSATAANGNVNPNWDFTNTWVMYNGYTYPLLRSFMTPLTVTANSGSVTYNGSANNGANGVTYSVAPNGNLFGTLTFNSGSGPAVNVGTYVITPGGLYSNQQGYIISYGSGNLTITQLASVAWVGGATGNWSTASNWAGGAIPDYSNVAAVTIPNGDTVTYDTGMAGLGTTKLTTLTSGGNLIMSAGVLDTTGNLSTAGYTQTGGTLDVDGSLTIQSTAGNVTLGNVTAGSVSITATAGIINQLASTAIQVAGAAGLTADNGVSGAGDVKYGIQLGNAANVFGGTVTIDGKGVTLTDSASSGLTLGNVTATGEFLVTTTDGGIQQAASSSVSMGGATTLTADNGVSGAGDVKYRVTLTDTGNSFGTSVSTDGSNVALLSSGANELTLGDMTASGTLSVTSTAALIRQAAGSTIDVTKSSSFTADNGVSGAGDVKYDLTLADTANTFGGAVSTDGLNVSLTNGTGALSLGNTTASGTLTVDSLHGAITQAAKTSIDGTGTSSFTANNGVSGAGDVKYGITLNDAANDLVGTVTANGSAITIDDSAALTASLESTGTASLTAAGPMNVSGSIGTNLTTVTTGTGSTTFGDTTIGTSLSASSAGAITQMSGTSLAVTGATTLKAQNGSSYDGITLADAKNNFGAAVTATGSNIELQSSTGNLELGNTTATGTLTVAALGGAVTQAKGDSVDVTGLVTAEGSAVTLDSSAALSADVTSTGAVSLTAAGPLEVSGSIGTNLTTVATGSGSTTTFGDTTVGKNLNVTSPGAVSTLAGDTLTVDGNGTTKPNKHVTVNGVNDVAILVQ
jgi:filamentous hemagglutinin family protein